jgi:hypothetical protein
MPHRDIKAVGQRPAHVLNFQRVGSTRHFDAADFSGRTLGLKAEGESRKRRGNKPAACI